MTSKRGQIAIKHHLEEEERKKEKLAIQKLEVEAKAISICNGFTLYPKTPSKNIERLREIKEDLDEVAYNRQMDKIDQEHGFE